MSESLLNDDPSPEPAGGGDQPQPGNEPPSGGGDQPQPAGGDTPEPPSLPDDVKNFAVAVEQKPDWLPEQFWDGENNQIRVGSLTKAFADNQKAARSKVDPPKVPESPDGYELNAPEIENFKIDKDSDLWKNFIKTAHEQGMTQEQVDAALNVYAQTVSGAAPDPEAEKKTIIEQDFGGNEEKYNAAVEDVSRFVNKNFEGEEKELARAVASNRLGLNFLRKVAKLSQQSSMPADAEGKSQPALPSREEINKAMMDPRFGPPGSPKMDPEYRDKWSKINRQWYERHGGS